LGDNKKKTSPQKKNKNKKKEQKALFWLVGLAYYQGKNDIVFRFIIGYSSLRDFPPPKPP